MQLDLPRLAVRRTRHKGRGLFAAESIMKGAAIEVAPVLLFPIARTKSAVLDKYTFEWDDDTAALALGKASLMNHSFRPNVVYRMDRSKQVIRFIAYVDIKVGAELTINYNYEPDDMRPVGFRVR